MLKEAGSRQSLSQQYFLEVLQGEHDPDKLTKSAQLLTPLNRPDKSQFANALSNETLPNLLANFDKNRFRIAVALSFVDSRTLPSDMRTAIGLNPQPSDPSPRQPESAIPKFFRPTEKKHSERKWTFLCGASEYFLARTLNPNRDSSGNSYDFLGCLKGKNIGVISGLCYQTKEFPNGAIFIEGVWYVLRSPSLVKKVKKVDEKKRPDTIVWEDCGGIWQPARAFASLGSIDSLYSQAELKNFLGGQSNVKDIYERRGQQPPTPPLMNDGHSTSVR